MTIVLQALARRVARIKPAGEATPHLNNTLRGWKTLPARLIARNRLAVTSGHNFRVLS
ncbi:hypothetical protein [Bradyrhizobium sp. STM 3561]|uniref:hypothetical protein n=1 Tax=unclassified Bradyrhizobium TaxID=2631580 RepID=UPI003890234A